MNQVLAYLPNVIVAIVIFVLAAAHRRRRRRCRRHAHGGHPDRQDRGHGRARDRHGHRDVHDPQPAQDRRADRHDRLRRDHGRPGPRPRPRLRSRRPPGRRAPARGRLPQGPRQRDAGARRPAPPAATAPSRTSRAPRPTRRPGDDGWSRRRLGADRGYSAPPAHQRPGYARTPRPPSSGRPCRERARCSVVVSIRRRGGHPAQDASVCPPRRPHHAPRPLEGVLPWR